MTIRQRPHALQTPGFHPAARVIVALAIAVAVGGGAIQASALAGMSQEPEQDAITDIAGQELARLLFGDLFRGAGDSTFVQAILADTVVHTPSGDSQGPAALSVYMERLRLFFPEGRFAITNITTSGNIIVVQWTIVDQPGAGEPVRMPGTAVMRLGDEAIAEMWIQLDPPEESTGDEIAVNRCPHCQIP